MAKINKRTIILLIVALAIWAVAIIFLIRVNSPKPVAEVKPVQPSQTPGSTQQTNQNVQDQSPASGSQNQQTGTTQQNQSISLVELKNIMPESTFTDFLTPYKLDLKVSLRTGFSQFQSNKEAAEEAYPKPASTSDQIIENIESISTSEFHYLGFISIIDGKREVKRVYLQVGNETKSYLENQLIEGKYKIIQIQPSFIVVLDTTDGKIKKVDYFTE
ncbi:MAG: hypothetical protein QW051_04535 [Candidatus Aenigmatarchaeota archaeon]